MTRKREPGPDDAARPRRRERAVTAEEAALWDKVKATVEPLAPGGPAERAPRAKPEGVPSVVPPTRPWETAAAGRTPGRADVSDLQPFEPRRARRLARGRLEIEARLDLHGMTQAEAHAALVRFIARACADGLRHVKIITGKGGPRAGDEEVPDWMSGRDGRGVLRRMVPVWLGEPGLRASIVSFTGAGRGHGGEGALYVQLRRGGRRRGER